MSRIELDPRVGASRGEAPTDQHKLRGDAERVDAVLGPMRIGEMLLLFLAQLTIFMALVVPSAFSLAIKISALVPEQKDTILAITIGLAGTVVLFTNPVIGVLSDRTRSRLGRRRPWLIAALLVGTLGSVVISLAASPLAIVVGWVIGLAGYSLATQSLMTYLGDRLPESQRGRVMGVLGAVTQVGPILGIVLAGFFSTQVSLLFIVPAAVALTGGFLFVVVMKDPKFTGEVPPFRVRALARGFYFNPRKHANFGWVILSKVFIFASLSFTGLYSVYVLMSRLGLNSGEVAAVFASMSLGSLVCAVVGATGSGFLSDRLRTRRPFLIVSALILVASPIVVGTGYTLVQIVVGTLLGSFGIGVYGAVDQALALDVLPREENENGRYLSIYGLANAVPQALGPFIAGAVLVAAAGDYTWVYVVAAGLALVGGLAIIPITAGRRADLPPSLALPTA